MKKLGLVAAAIAVFAVAATAAPQSGLKPGSPVGAFDVVDVTGPNKGKQLCYRCSYGGNPVAAAFIKPGSPNAALLVQGIQKLANENKGLKTFVVMMGGQETKATIEKIASEKKITIPVTFLPGGASASDIASYKISPDADNTVMLWSKGSVRHTMVNVDKSTWAEVEKAASELVK